MESRETINLDQLKLEAQEYSVYITDTRKFIRKRSAVLSGRWRKIVYFYLCTCA